MSSPAQLNLTFTPVTATDQARLLSLMQRIYPPAYAHFWPDGGEWYVESQYGQKNFAREMEDSTAGYEFICQAGRPVGIVRTLPGLPPPEHPEMAATKLHRLYLDQAVQGRGVGRSVIDRVAAASRERGDVGLWLEAMDSSVPALAFYERLGFSRLTHFTLEMPRMYPARRGMWRLIRKWAP